MCVCVCVCVCVHMCVCVWMVGVWVWVGVEELDTHRMRVSPHSRDGGELTKVTKSLTLKRSDGRLESRSML